MLVYLGRSMHETMYACCNILMMIFLAKSSYAFQLQRIVRHGPLASTATTRNLIRCYGGSAPNADKRKSAKDGTIAKPETLEWESFEFSNSPKWDQRFFLDPDSKISKMKEDHTPWQDMVEEETKQDIQSAQQINANTKAWEQLSPQLIAQATQVLRPYVKPDRMERIENVLSQRTAHTRFLFENPSNPSNAWACLRTLDAFGIQHVDVIIQSEQYKGKAALTQKRGMRTAMGSARWLTLRNHASTAEAIAAIRAQQPNIRIYASDVNANAQDIRTIEWDVAKGDGKTTETEDSPICIVMGNEERGISDEMRQLVQGTFYLPMSGFAESFNLSVATAITLAYLSAASNEGHGPLRPGDLSEQEYNALFFKGVYHSVAQKRAAQTLLKQAGLELPMEIMRFL